MRQNDGCDPELRLCLGSSCADSRCTETTTSSSRANTWLEERFGSRSYIPREQPKHMKQLTIFYNGQICVCDATDIQARAIITMARREMDERKMMIKNDDLKQLLQLQEEKPSSLSSSLPQSSSPPPSSSPAALQQLLIMNNSGLSMKRSLQRFLQKRKVRLDAASPYSHKQYQLLFPIKS